MSETSTLLAMLERHYIKPGDTYAGGVFLPECGLNGRTGRRCDALYAGFTSASGRILIGHELKVSRSDWRHELETVGKADTFADQCHAWYVVAPSTDIVPPNELPPGWGLMVPGNSRSRRMTTVRAAQLYLERTPSWLITRSMMARLDTLRVQREHEVQQAALKAADERFDQRVAAEEKYKVPRKVQERLAVLDRLEEILGPVDRWSWDLDHFTPEAAAAYLRWAKSAKDGASRVAVAQQMATAATRMLAAVEEFTAAGDLLTEITGERTVR